MNSQLMVSVLGEDRARLVENVAEVVRTSGCNLQESRMSVLGSAFAMIFLANGNWNTLGKLEQALGRLAETQALVISTQRTRPRSLQGAFIPYAVDVVALDQPGIVHELGHFFAIRETNIQNLVTTTYQAPHTGSAMFALHMVVEIPGDTHLATLRDEFLDLCDELNLDGILEPVKP